MTGEIESMGVHSGQNSRVSLETLAKMTGFPMELIQQEVFQGQNMDQISMEDLRSAMLKFIDSTMLIND
jgi:hypothetical protein